MAHNLKIINFDYLNLELKEIKSTQEHELFTNTFNLKFDIHDVQFLLFFRLFFLFKTTVYNGKIVWTADVYPDE